MRIKYYFEDEYPYEYEADEKEYIENHYSIEQLADTYIEEIYNKDAKVRDDFKRELDVNNSQELKDYIIEFDDVDWVIDDILETKGLEAIDIGLEDDIKDYYESDAYDEYLDVKDIADNDEWVAKASRYW